MQLVAPDRNLFQACQTLFGAETDISRDFLQYLQLSGLKSAYRKRAFETHPDRVAGQGEEMERQNAELFRSIRRAYEELSAYVEAREKGYTFSSRHTKVPRGTYSKTYGDFDHHTPAYTSSKIFSFETDSFYTGPMPDRPLLFGHFLYYAGEINWRDIVQALIWQRSQRPRLGEIACKLGMLNEKDVLRILKSRKIMQPFGQAAVKLGLLTETQLQILVAHQNRLQRKMGDFFLEFNIIPPAKLKRLILEHQLHNARFMENHRRQETTP